MRTLDEQLAKYAAYHRNRRNIAIHLVGIPMIVLAVAALLSRPALHGFSPALLVTAAAVAYYFVLDRRYGAAMALLMGASVWAGARLAALPAGQWLGAGIALFVAGWIIQFIGHAIEGRKPAFVDDLAGLVIGPLFVVAEAGFLFGLREEVRRAVEEKAGPTRLGPAPARAPAQDAAQVVR